MIADRERTAERLLNSSARNSYDPDVDIDWEAPLAPDKYFLPAHRCTLYGTPLWEGLTQEQRIELTKHELASIASVGIWFEVILMELLVRHSYNADPLTRHTQYALTEVADECRHSVMFARLIERVGCPAYGPGQTAQRLGRLFKSIAFGPSMYAGILVAEEITDALQRESMNDDTVQPLVRMVNRIHVIEEARHVRYAREEVLRDTPKLSRAGLAYHRAMLARTAFIVTRALVHPKVYRSVGLDPYEARRVAWANPHHRDTIRWAGSKLVSFLDENDLIGGPSRRVWQAVGLV
ncbi:diiron oxygenase [Kutzneria buriramensis]|uniref:Para-aminobenzoate N-oxygenase AurF n=1 Tax=Kutzneria buriramensis TaxID=1045776 RepID=A0A3E0HC50_9PSEU|nr:diiron oxygenase [Kutzneria buriramensis]REH42015.1 para-aminobenzoate N-oxygenase AurF [Kutzneria buriramensis]